MPIVVFALLAYLGGLLAGFTGSIIVGIVAAIGAAAVGSHRGRFVALAFAALTSGGIMAARASSGDAETCLADAERSQAVKLVLDDSASPGAFVRGRVEGCDAFASLSIRSGGAPVGSTVLARGALMRSERGVHLKGAAITLVRGPRVLRRWRSNAGESIERVFGVDAPLVKALLIADWRELTPEVKDRYAAAGLSH